MDARAVTWGEVVSTVTHAEVTDEHEGRKRFFRRDLCVVVAGEVVVTVLMRSSARWTDRDVRGRRRFPE